MTTRLMQLSRWQHCLFLLCIVYIVTSDIPATKIFTFSYPHGSCDAKKVLYPEQYKFLQTVPMAHIMQKWWTDIAQEIMRPPCCDKPNMRKAAWAEEEDPKTFACVPKDGTSSWTAVPKKTGIKRCGKSYRFKGTNYMGPDTKHESFTPQEEELIVTLHAAIGSRWPIIAQQLPGRTENEVKNLWNSKLKKKLTQMGIDPVTHKPFSQILADYGKIGGLPKSRTRVGTLNKDLNNSFMFTSEQSPIIPPAENFSKNFSSTHVSTSMTTKTKMEPTESSLLSNCNQSLDLLAELQSIAIVTKATISNYDTLQPHFFSDSSLRSPPSSSSSSIATEIKPPSSFSWHDFLLDEDDATIFAENAAKKVNLETLQAEMNAEKIKSFEAAEGMECSVPVTNGFKDSAPSDSSFVEAMLDGGVNDMFLEFPDLLEEPFHY